MVIMVCVLVFEYAWCANVCLRACVRVCAYASLIYLRHRSNYSASECACDITAAAAAASGPEVGSSMNERCRYVLACVSVCIMLCA